MRSMLNLVVVAAALAAFAPAPEAPRTWSMDDGAVYPAARGLPAPKMVSPSAKVAFSSSIKPTVCA